MSKLGLGEMPPTTITAIRALIAGAVFSVLAIWRAPLGRPLDLRDAIACAVLGLTGLVGNTTVWYWGLAHTTPLNAGIIGAASPMLVALASWLVLGDRLTARGLSVVAVVVTVAKGSLTVLVELAINRGDLIVLASQALWVDRARARRDLPEPDAVRGDRAHVGDAGRAGPRLPPRGRGPRDRRRGPGDAPLSGDAPDHRTISFW